MIELFKKKITKTNFSKIKNKKNEFLAIHYVGAVSKAKNNADYFFEEYRGASAHLFIDEKEVWQVVEFDDVAWHVGAKKYYNDCRNNNSIGIEMCCKKDEKGLFYIDEETVENTLAVSCWLCQKYNIPLDHVVRHFDTTRKNLS